MSSPPEPAGIAAPQPAGEILLSDVLIALQKTFSRLSGVTAVRTNEEFRSQPLAIIVGDVNFELSLNVAPAAVHSSHPGESRAKSDSLRYCSSPNEGFSLRLQGRIATDVRHEEAHQPPPDADIAARPKRAAPERGN